VIGNKEDVRLERILATLQRPIDPLKLLEAQRSLELANKAIPVRNAELC
jgi:hypothetical protein